MPSSSDAEKGTAESPKEADANSKQQQVCAQIQYNYKIVLHELWVKKMRFQLISFSLIEVEISKAITNKLNP